MITPAQLTPEQRRTYYRLLITTPSRAAAVKAALSTAPALSQGTLANVVATYRAGYNCPQSQPAQVVA